MERQEAECVTERKLRQIKSLVRELEEERDRYAREVRHHRRMEECYGVRCLIDSRPLVTAHDRLAKIEAACEDQRQEVERWIDCQSDSMTRRALRLRYLDGKSWAECARRMGYADESGPRKLVAKLLPEKQYGNS